MPEYAYFLTVWSRRGLSWGGLRRGKMGFSAADLDEEAKKIMSLQREVALKVTSLVVCGFRCRERRWGREWHIDAAGGRSVRGGP